MRRDHGRLRRSGGAGGGTLIVDIHYRRLPDDEQVFTQEIVLDRDDVKVTLARSVPLEAPVLIHDEVVLEPGSDAVWFTFPGKWHDIGRFHRRDDSLTGIYANILTPPVLEPPPGAPEAGPAGASAAPDRGASEAPAVARTSRAVWHTTDLFLDIWLPPTGGFHVLDEDQLEEAVAEGWVDPTTARRARDEVKELGRAHGAGLWPPSVVEEWTLERARDSAAGGGGNPAADPSAPQGGDPRHRTPGFLRR